MGGGGAPGAASDGSPDPSPGSADPVSSVCLGTCDAPSGGTAPAIRPEYRQWFFWPQWMQRRLGSLKPAAAPPSAEES